MYNLIIIVCPTITPIVWAQTREFSVLEQRNSLRGTTCLLTTYLQHPDHNQFKKVYV